MPGLNGRPRGRGLRKGREEPDPADVGTEEMSAGTIQVVERPAAVTAAAVVPAQAAAPAESQVPPAGQAPAPTASPTPEKPATVAGNVVDDRSGQLDAAGSSQSETGTETESAQGPRYGQAAGSPDVIAGPGVEPESAGDVAEVTAASVPEPKPAPTGSPSAAAEPETAGMSTTAPEHAEAAIEDQVAAPGESTEAASATPAEVAPAAPAVKAVAKKPTKAVAKKAAAPVAFRPDGDGDPAWAGEAVAAARKSARRAPQEWGGKGVRVAEFAKKRLEDRRNRDQAAAGAGHRISESHYVEAALAGVPATLDEARDLVNGYWDYLEEAGLPDRPSTVSLSTRVRIATYETANGMSESMRSAVRYGMTGALYTALLLRLLDALDALDEAG
jgi:hypothetical protein